MRPRRPPSDSGQSLVEFSLVLMPLFVIVLAIVQFGFVFNAYVTLTNATREGARNGTVYIYDSGLSKAQNDLARNEFIRTSLLASMNLLSKTSPQFATGSTWTLELMAASFRAAASAFGMFSATSCSSKRT